MVRRPGWNSVTVKAPVPMGLVKSVVPSLTSANWNSPTSTGRSASGAASSMTKPSSPSGVTEVMLRASCLAVEDTASSVWRMIENAMSCAVSGLPSLKVMPLRNLKCQLVPASSGVHSVATSGRAWPDWSSRVR